MTGLVGAVVLAGGGGRRLGGLDKPSLLVDGQSLLARALAAVAPAPTVVVGPTRPLPDGVVGVTEDPPGSGPAAAVAAGVLALHDLLKGSVGGGAGAIALLAADLPTVHRARLAMLTLACPPGGGAVLVDPGDREQWLYGVWQLDALTARIGSADWSGRPLHRLLAGLPVVRLPATADQAADIDTPSDLARWADTPGSTANPGQPGGEFA